MDANRRFEDAKRPRRWLTFAGALMAIVVGVAGAQAVSPGEHLSPSPASTAAPAAHTRSHLLLLLFARHCHQIATRALGPRISINPCPESWTMVRLK